MREEIIELLGKEKRALSATEICDKLNLNTAGELKKLLDDLRILEEGYTVYRSNKDKYMLFENSHLLKGRLSVNKKGFGFVIVDGRDEDIYIDAKNMNGALNNDLVVVEELKGQNGKKTEGRVVKVLKKENNLTDHVRATIQKYGDKLESFDLKRFNKNIVDPVKLIFDKTVYRATWEETIGNEIFRQRDKANNNDIGYFHQRIFQYIDKCHVPANGEEGGWDVIYENPDGIKLPDGSVVHRVYVEMKNKHNTMNSAAAGKTFIKMQSQLLKDDDCACFLVEAIAKKSQNIKWETSVDNQKVGHKLIRRVSMDKFYALVTGQDDAFYQICMALPEVIQKVVEMEGENLVPHDTVIDELQKRVLLKVLILLFRWLFIC